MNPRIDLSTAHVHIAGFGRLGSGIGVGMSEARVGHLSFNDKQSVDEEQFLASPTLRRCDIGRLKVDVFARLLDGRPYGAISPIAMRNQSPAVNPFLESANVIVSCANRYDARVYIERAAVRLRKPCIQVCAQDARNTLGGLISVWTPSSSRSCFECLFPTGAPARPPGEVLLPTVTGLIARLAANVTIDILTGKFVDSEGNLFIIDAARYSIERLSVTPRQGCKTCSPSQRVKS